MAPENINLCEKEVENFENIKYKKKVLLGCSSQPRPYNLDLLVEFLLLSINLLCVFYSTYLLFGINKKKNLKVSSDLFLHVILIIYTTTTTENSASRGTTLSIKNANSKSSNQHKTFLMPNDTF